MASKKGKKNASVVAEEVSNLPVPIGTGMVTLADQDAQLQEMGTASAASARGAIEGELVESAGDAAVAGLPWTRWPDAEHAEVAFDRLRVVPNDEGTRLLLEVPGFDPAPLNGSIYKELGWMGGFPHEFVLKLSPNVAATVMNERMSSAKKKGVLLIREGGNWTSMADPGREFIPAREIASTLYEAMGSAFPGDPITWEDEIPEEPHYLNGVLTMRFFAPEFAEVRDRINPLCYAQGITDTKRDDVLQFGVQIRQQYPYPMELSLYVRRLVCINGLILASEDCLWRGDQKKADRQKAWIVERIEKLQPEFQAVALEANRLAATALPTDRLMPELIADYGRRNGIQKRYVAEAVRAWDDQTREEGEDRTEWGIANAYTRAFRDLRGDPRLGDGRLDMMGRIGEAVRGNQIVTARLRRKDATRVGAEIVEEEAVAA